MPAELSPHPVDVHVGARLRLRRKLLGVSQAQLADDLNLTFQQIQKYERGANRISASTLYALARLLQSTHPVSTAADRFYQGRRLGERPTSGRHGE